MKIKGRCYCGQIKFEFDGEPLTALQCHCRECQYITGGFPNSAMVLPNDGFRFVLGEPKTFTRTDIEAARTRLFCENCGTSLATKSPKFPSGLVVKVGTFDDPSVFKPVFAQFLKDAPAFHHVPDGLPAHRETPSSS